MTVDQLLKHTNINKVDVIHDLLEKIGKLEFIIHQKNCDIEDAHALHKSIVQGMIDRQNAELQTHMEKHAQHLAQMEIINEVCAQNYIKVPCRKCGEDYELPCDISEYDPEYSYCGKGGPSPCTP